MPSSLSFLLYNSADLLVRAHTRGRSDVNLDQCNASSDNTPSHERETYRARLARQRIISDNKWRRLSLRNEDKPTATQPLRIERTNDNLSLNASQHRPSLIPRWSRSLTTCGSNPMLYSSSPLSTNTTGAGSSSSPSRNVRDRSGTPLRTSTSSTNKLSTAETRRVSVNLPVRSNSLPRSNSPRQLLVSSSNRLHPMPVNDHSKAHSSLSKEAHKRLSSSDDDDAETNNLKEDDLKRRLREEKRQSKRTAEILSKLHENYEELLEKYAQAENTIDQLRFQPTPSRGGSRSSGIGHSLADSPFSSMRPASCSVTSAVKIESVFYDETTSQSNLIHEPVIPETVRLDLLIHTKKLGNNMKSFLTLMDANQVNEVEQQQAYENIKQDYRKLIRTLEQQRQDSGSLAVDVDGDLNKELELMKQLLKEIATRITGNLFGKSADTSPFDRHSLLTYEDSHSSQFDRSSLCNHEDLMDQYKKLLTAVNKDNAEKKDRMQSMMNGLETTLRKSKSSVSPQASSLDTFENPTTTDQKQRPCVYISAGSEDEHQQSTNISPIPFTKGVESTSPEFEHIPSTLVEQHEHTIQEEPPSRPPSILIKRSAIPIGQEYHRLGDLLVNESKANDTRSSGSPSQDDCNAEIISHIQHGKQCSPELHTDTLRHSNNSSKTRAHDCDSGIGTTTVTKGTCDSKHCATPMDESQLQSLDEGRASISSSLHSTGSDSGSLFGKHIKRFVSPTIRCRKSSRPSDSYLSDADARPLHPLDPHSQNSSHHKKMHRSDYTWSPQRVPNPHRSRLTLFNRNASTGRDDVEEYTCQAHHPLVSSRVQTRARPDRPQHSASRKHRSSLYIDHTHERRKHTAPPEFHPEAQQGVVHRCQPVEQYRCDHRVSAQKKVYRCGKCGSVTPYHSRRHGNSASRQTAAQLDDLGYESEQKKRSQSCRHIDSASSSDSDSDLSPTYLQMIALNEAFDRAEKVENCSQRLSRYITRQLKLALTLI